MVPFSLSIAVAMSENYTVVEFSKLDMKKRKLASFFK